MHTRKIFICGLGMLLAGCAPEPAVAPAAAGKIAGLPADAQAKVEVARLGIQAFAGELRQKLDAAIEKGGATLAIEVCQTEAASIAKAHGSKLGGTIGRTSLGLRNTANQPDEWEISTIGKFSSLLAAGSSPARLEAAVVTDNPDGSRSLRFAKGIVTDTLCLTCHGEAVAAPIKAKIESLYPEDKATGFKEGSLRGIFTVTLPLDGK